MPRGEGDLDPPSRNVPLSGGEFGVSVLVDDVDQLGAFEFRLDYDPNTIEYKGVQFGTFLDGINGSKNCPTYPDTADGVPRIMFGCGG